jgi:ribosomal protein L17
MDQRMGDNEEQLLALEYLLRKWGHNPTLFVRMGRRVADSFRCRECGYVRVIGMGEVDEESIAPCMAVVDEEGMRDAA